MSLIKSFFVTAFSREYWPLYIVALVFFLTTSLHTLFFSSASHPSFGFDQEAMNNYYLFKSAIHAAGISLLLFVGIILSIKHLQAASKGKMVASALFAIILSVGIGIYVYFGKDLPNMYWHSVILSLIAVGSTYFITLPYFGEYDGRKLFLFLRSFVVDFIIAGIVSAIVMATLTSAYYLVTTLFGIGTDIASDIIETIASFVILLIYPIVLVGLFARDMNKGFEDLIVVKFLTNIAYFLGVFIGGLYSTILVVYMVYYLFFLFQKGQDIAWLSSFVTMISIAVIFLNEYLEYSFKNLVKRVFQVFAIIATLMYLFAVIVRISEYGFTHERLLAIVLAIWAAVIIGYTILRDSYNLGYVLLSLPLTVAIVIVVPFVNIFALSDRDQMARVNDLLADSSKAKLEFNYGNANISGTEMAAASSGLKYIKNISGIDTLASRLNLSEENANSLGIYLDNYFEPTMGYDYYTPIMKDGNGSMRWSFSREVLFYNNLEISTTGLSNVKVFTAMTASFTSEDKLEVGVAGKNIDLQQVIRDKCNFADLMSIKCGDNGYIDMDTFKLWIFSADGLRDTDGTVNVISIQGFIALKNSK